MRVVKTIPRDKARNFAAGLIKELSGNYSNSKVDMVNKLNRKLKGWANFYQFTDFTAKIYSHIDGVMFWKLGYWLARKYRIGIKPLMKKWFKRPKSGKAKSWILHEVNSDGQLCMAALSRLVGSQKKQFRWRLPEENPYLRLESRNTVTSRYRDVAMALSHC